MGKNVSWLCKALGSEDVALEWHLPRMRSADEIPVVRSGACVERACARDNVLTVRYLHPRDAGKYTCVARNKFGQDQRQVKLAVKVR